MKECNNSISKIHISSNVIFSILWFYSSHIIDILHLVDITNEYIDIRFTEFATLIYIYVCVCIYIYCYSFSELQYGANQRKADISPVYLLSAALCRVSDQHFVSKLTFMIMTTFHDV